MLLLGPGDEEDDLLGVERFAVGQPSVRIAANAAEQIGELAADDLAAEDFVIQPVVGQVMLVEEMAERPVADVVQQGGHPHQRFDVAAAGHVGTDLAEALVERGDRPARQVHCPEHVLEARMFGRGKDPPGGLQLVNLPQPLKPGVVDQFAFGHFPYRQARRRGEGNVAVDRIVAEAFALEVFHGGTAGAGDQGPEVRVQRSGAGVHVQHDVVWVGRCPERIDADLPGNCNGKIEWRRRMTTPLTKAFEEAAQLPDTEQNAITR